MEGRLGALGIAALVHVYAKANQKPRELFCAAAREAAGRAHQFSPQQLANVAWSYAKVNVDAPQLFEAIGREAARRADDFKPQELTNAAWLFAKVGPYYRSRRPTSDCPTGTAGCSPTNRPELPTVVHLTT